MRTAAKGFGLLLAALGGAAMQAPAGASDALPLRADRHLRFATTEVTWSSVDVSPDGRTIVFDLLGDLYLLPAGGGTARPLTRGMAWDGAPRFSPDGRSIAFSSDRGGSRGIWRIDLASGRARQLLSGDEAELDQPNWSPDGRAILARRIVVADGRTDNISLWLFDLQTGAGRPLAAGSAPAGQAGERPLQYYASQGTFLADRVLVPVAGSTFGFMPRSCDIWSVGADAPRPTPWRGCVVRVSPDGRMLAAVEVDAGALCLRVRSLAADGGIDRRIPLTTDTDPDLVEGKDVSPGFAFTPDSRFIVYADGGGLRRLDLATGDVSEIPFRAEVDLGLASPVVARRRHVANEAVQVRQLRSAQRAADGTLIFAAAGRLWRMAPGRPTRRLTEGDRLETDPALSPDGRSIAYLTWSDSEGNRLWRMPAAGGAPVPLTSAPYLLGPPAWTPDGRAVVMLGAQAESWTGPGILGERPRLEPALMSVDAASGALRTIATAGYPWEDYFTFAWRQFTPTVSIANGRAYFLVPGPPGRENNRYRLRSVSLDGEPATADVIEFAIGATGLDTAVSPDGRWLALQNRYDIALARMPSPGAGAAVIDLADPDPALVRPVTREGGTGPRWTGTRLSWTAADQIFSARVEAFDRIGGRTSQRVALRLPQPRNETPVLLTNARIIQMVAGQTIERGDVLVVWGRIAAIGPAGTIAAPPGTRRLDLTGKTIIPGLIGTHEHMMMYSWDARRLRSPQWESRLAYGVTTVADPGQGWFAAEMAERIAAGHALGPRWFGTLDQLGPGRQTIGSQAEAIRIARTYRRLGATLLKIRTPLNRLQRQWLAIAARREGMNLAIHQPMGGAAALQLEPFVDGFTSAEHQLNLISPIHGDVRALVLGTGTTASGWPGLGPSVAGWDREREAGKLAYFGGFGRGHSIDRDSAAAMARRFDREVEGGRVCDLAADRLRLTNGSDTNYGLATHAMMWRLVLGCGLTPAQVLEISTINGARLLGIDADLGTLEPGKIADLVILNANPLADIRSSTDIFAVMKNGVLYRGSDLSLP